MKNINDIVLSLPKQSSDIISEAKMAKDILTKSDALPFEKPYLNKVITGGESSSYIEGYDGEYPRINMNMIENATVRKGFNVFPSFAIYDVFDTSGLCTKTFSVSSRRYKDYSNLDMKKAQVPLLMRPVLYLVNKWNNYTEEGAVMMALFSLFFQLAWIGVIEAGKVNSSWQYFWLGLVICGVFSIVWHGLAAKFENARIDISTTYSHSFDGVIPANIKRNILEHKKKFNKIYLIEEAYNWKVQNGVSFTKIKDPDPLIVGEYGGAYFLLEKFDLTSLEDYISKEATIRLTKD